MTPRREQPGHMLGPRFREIQLLEKQANKLIAFAPDNPAGARVGLENLTGEIINDNALLAIDTVPLSRNRRLGQNLQ